MVFWLMVVTAIVLGLPILAVLIWNVLGLFGIFRAWKAARVRAKEFGPPPDYPYYVRLTPNFGVGLPWGYGERLRMAAHHGIQITQRNTAGRWVVRKQVFGKSKVKGERFLIKPE